MVIIVSKLMKPYSELTNQTQHRIRKALIKFVRSTGMIVGESVDAFTDLSIVCKAKTKRFEVISLASL